MGIRQLFRLQVDGGYSDRPASSRILNKTLHKTRAEKKTSTDIEDVNQEMISTDPRIKKKKLPTQKEIIKVPFEHSRKEEHNDLINYGTFLAIPAKTFHTVQEY